VDSHCHLTDKRLITEIDEVVDKARRNGVERIMTAGVNIEDGNEVVELVKKFKMIDGVVGIHPEFVGEGEDGEEKMRELITLLEKGRRWIKGIGEIGLDFYYDKKKETRVEQMKLMEKQMEIAREMNLPVVIHMREAEEEMKECLEESGDLRGVFHCWGGSKEMLKMVLEKGFYVSMAGNVTFKSADKLREMLKMVPKERLLLETDAPYLSPEPVRGRLNEPKNVKILAKFVAETRGESLGDLVKQTGENYLCLFG